MFTSRLHIQQVTFPLDEQADWLNDPRNTEFSEQRHHHHDKASCAKYIAECSVFWGIQEIDSGEWIGTASAFIDEHNEVADVGILIHWEYAGKGYGKEAWGRICDFLLESRGLRKVEAGCMATNKPMRRLAESAGMVLDGERKNHFLSKEGHPVGMLMYAKWPKGR